MTDEKECVDISDNDSDNDEYKIEENYDDEKDDLYDRICEIIGNKKITMNDLKGKLCQIDCKNYVNFNDSLNIMNCIYNSLDDKIKAFLLFYKWYNCMITDDNEIIDRWNYMIERNDKSLNYNVILKYIESIKDVNNKIVKKCIIKNTFFTENKV